MEMCKISRAEFSFSSFGRNFHCYEFFDSIDLCHYTNLKTCYHNSKCNDSALKTDINFINFFTNINHYKSTQTPNRRNYFNYLAFLYNDCIIFHRIIFISSGCFPIFLQKNFLILCSASILQHFTQYRLNQSLNKALKLTARPVQPEEKYFILNICKINKIYLSTFDAT